MTNHQDSKEALRALPFLPTATTLFDSLADVVFFVKDADARYVTVNKTLIQRCGKSSRDEVIGKTTLDLFPAPFAQSYHEQDQSVIDNDTEIDDQLELQLYLQGGAGWCVPTKLPLHDDTGHVIGLVGVSNDIHAPAEQDSGYRELAEGINHIQQHISEPLRVDALAELCGLSLYQFEQRMKRVFHLTAGQFISKTRIDAARRMLKRDDTPIVEVALACGHSNQSAFTRQFKLTAGLTPSAYRRSG